VQILGEGGNVKEKGAYSKCEGDKALPTAVVFYNRPTLSIVALLDMREPLLDMRERRINGCAWKLTEAQFVGLQDELLTSHYQRSIFVSARDLCHNLRITRSQLRIIIQSSSQ